MAAEDVDGAEHAGGAEDAGARGVPPVDGRAGGGNATVQQKSALHATCESPIFTCGADIWDYLNSAGIVYLRIADDAAQEEIRKVQTLTSRRASNM